MGFKVGRQEPAKVLETKKTARYGEQKVVATETPVVEEEKVEEAPVVEESAEEAPQSEKPKKKGGRKPKKA